MQWKLAECCEESGDIPGAIASTRRAIKLIDALADEDKISSFDTYTRFFTAQINRLASENKQEH